MKSLRSIHFTAETPRALRQISEPFEAQDKLKLRPPKNRRIGAAIELTAIGTPVVSHVRGALQLRERVRKMCLDGKFGDAIIFSRLSLL